MSLAFEVMAQCFSRGHRGFPSELRFDLLVRVSMSLPVCGVLSAIEHRRQLATRPEGISLPQVTEQRAQGMGDIDRAKREGVAFVECQKGSARRKIVVDDIEDLPIDSGRESGEDNGLRTVADIGQGKLVAAAQMEKDAEVGNSHTSGYTAVSGTIHDPGPRDHIGDVV